MKNHDFIKSQLSKILGDIEVEYFASIGSSNDYILAKTFEHKYQLCYADIQTKARGQRGNRWVSEAKDNLYFTIGFKCNFDISQNPLSSVKVAIGILETIKDYLYPNLRDPLKVKLPNDIYYKDEKLGGVLIETKNIKKGSFDIIIGVGINANMFALEQNLDREWTSIAIINDEKVNSSKLLVDMVVKIIELFHEKKEIILEKFAKYDYIKNKNITFNYGDKVYQGYAKGISEDLKIILQMDKSEVAIDIANINKVRIVK